MARSPYPPINLLLATCQPAGHTPAAVHEDLGGGENTDGVDPGEARGRNRIELNTQSGSAQA